MDYLFFLLFQSGLSGKVDLKTEIFYEFYLILSTCTFFTAWLWIRLFTMFVQLLYTVIQSVQHVGTVLYLSIYGWVAHRGCWIYARAAYLKKIFNLGGKCGLYFKGTRKNPYMSTSSETEKNKFLFLECNDVHWRKTTTNYQ